jgi:GcrA cell cycle regulator
MSDWTVERFDLAKSLWSMGVSGGQIAATLGLTRSAVMGKLWRAGRVATEIHRHRRKRAIVFNKPSKPLVRIEGAADRSFNDISGPSYSILDLGMLDCRWPIGDDGKCFCAAMKETLTRPYCAQHNLVASR